MRRKKEKWGRRSGRSQPLGIRRERKRKSRRIGEKEEEWMRKKNQ